MPGFLDVILVLFVYAVRLETNSLLRPENLPLKTILFFPFVFL
jgi:hypothetical protein